MKLLRTFACACVLLGAGLPAQAQDDLLNALPDSTMLIVRVRDTSDLIADFQKSPFYLKRNEEGFRESTQAIEQHWEQMKAGAREELGIDLGEFLSSVKGDITVAIGGMGPVITRLIENATMGLGAPDVSPDEVPFLVAIDTEEGKDAFATNWKKILDKARGEGAKVDSKSFQGGTVTTISRPEGETDGPEKIFLGELGSRYLFSLNQEMVERTMARLKSGGGDGSLSALGSFKASMRETKEGESDLMAFVNVAGIVAAADTALRDHSSGIIWTKVRDLFIGRLDALSLTLALDGQGVFQRIFAHDGGSKTGILGWFEGNVPPRPSALIPEDTLAYSAMAFRFGKVLSAIREIASMAMGGADIDALVEAQTGIRLGDIERAFGDRVHTLQSQGQTPENPTGDLTLIFELNDEGPINRLLQVVNGMTGGAFAPQKYLGRDLYVLPAAGAPISPALMASDKLFVLGFDRSGVEKVVRRIGESSGGLASSPDFQKVANAFPQDIVAMSYTNAKLLQDTFSNMGQIFMLASEGDAPEWLGAFFNNLGHAFDTSTGYSQWRSAGLFSESKIPFKAQ
ncbi:MAG TPA: hypothetical protein VK116_07730 [Planctomycetota bacterium]|nr:hypothetical protein [Planctomycetota bacterium]